MIDEHSRLCLAIRVGRRCKAKDVVAVLEAPTSLYPAPAYIRSGMGRSSSPRPSVTGVRPEPPPPRPTSRLDPPARTALPSRSKAASVISSSTPSCSPQLQRHRPWPIVGAGSTTHSGRIRPSRGVCPWKQLHRELQHDHKHPLS